MSATGAPPPGRRPLGSRVLRLAAVVAVAALAAAVAASLFARGWVARALSDALGAPVSVTALWLSPRADLTLAGVRIGTATDGPSLSTITVDPDFRRLVRGELVVNQIAISGLRATMEAGADGMPAVRGVALPSGDGAAPAIDVREVVIRDSDLVGVPPAHFGGGPVDLHVDRMVARQVPTAAAGVRSYLATLRGSLDGVPLGAELAAEIAGAERTVSATAKLDEGRFAGKGLPLPRGVRSFDGLVSGTASYELDTGTRREEIRADLAVTRARLALDAGVAATAARLDAAGLTLDLASGWTWRAERIEVAGAQVSAEIGGREASVRAERAVLRAISSSSPGALSATLEPPGGGSAEVSGRLGVTPARADLEVRLDGVSVAEVAALVPAMPLAIARGAASATLQVASDGERHRVSGTVAASQVHTAPPAGQPEDVLAADRIEATFELDSGSRPELRFSSLALHYPYAMVRRTAAGTFPLAAMSGASPPPSPSTTSPSTASPTGPAPSPMAASDASPASDGGRPPRKALGVAIDELRLVSGRVDFVDETVTPIYWAGLASLSGVASDVAWPAATVGAFSLTALHDELSPVEASGRAHDAGVRTRAAAERLSAPSFNPYLSPLLGYRAESGTLTLRAEGTLQPDRFAAETSLSLEDLDVVQTGLDVIGRDTGVPLSVALALISDYEGDIELRVPVEGNPQTGDLRLGSFLAQAIRRAIMAAITSPLRLLGMLFGTDGPPHALAVDPIPFAAQSGRLDDAGAQRVAQIGRILAAHPELLLIAKAQLAASDRQGLSREDQERLASERAGAVRAALLGRETGGALGAVGRALGALRGDRDAGRAPAIEESRVIVAPWTPDESPAGDPIAGVYVELQAR